MVANSNSTLLVGYRNTPNDNLAVSGTSYVPKHAQPGFGRLWKKCFISFLALKLASQQLLSGTEI